MFLDLLKTFSGIVSYDSQAAGISGAALSLTGIFGALMFSILVDKTKKYKLILFIVVTGSSVLGLVLAVVVIWLPNSDIALYTISALFGFFAWSGAGIIMELVAVISFPIPEVRLVHKNHFYPSHPFHLHRATLGSFVNKFTLCRR